MVEKTQWTAFLAGPMNGAPSWQAQAPKVAAQVGNGHLSGKLGNLRTPYVRRDSVLDPASGPSYEALALLCYHHKTGNGRKPSAWP